MSGSPALLREAAAAPILTLEDIREHIVIEHEAHNALLETYIAAATRYFEQQTGLCLATQTWAQSWPIWPIGVRLARAPIVQLTRVGYWGADGAFAEMLSTDFHLRRDAIGVSIVPREGVALPALSCRPDAVEIEYQAGFGTAEDVPADMRHAVRALVAHYYENRASTSARGLAIAPHAAEAIIGTYRQVMA